MHEFDLEFSPEADDAICQIWNDALLTGPRHILCAERSYSILNRLLQQHGDQIGWPELPSNWQRLKRTPARRIAVRDPFQYTFHVVQRESRRVVHVDRVVFTNRWPAWVAGGEEVSGESVVSLQ